MSTALDTTHAPKLRSIVTELSTELFEREDPLRAQQLGDLTGEHTYLLGEPGVAKSLLVRKASERMIGSNFWEMLLDRQLDKADIFGPIDIIEFKATGVWHHRTDGYLPWAHKVFLDEVGKAGPAILNQLLAVMNEGFFHGNSKPIPCNALSIVGASNELLEDELAAMWDRWMMRLVVERIQEPRNFAALLGLSNQQPDPNPTTITLDEMMQAREAVTQITVPSGVIDSVIDLRADLYKDEIRPSDRRWRKSIKLLQANAYLAERDSVAEDDLEILRWVLWDHIEQIPTVEKKVLRRTSEETRMVSEWSETLNTLTSRIEAARNAGRSERAELATEVQQKLKKIETAASQGAEKWRRKGRSTAKIEDIQSRIRTTRNLMLEVCMNLSARDLS